MPEEGLEAGEKEKGRLERPVAEEAVGEDEGLERGGLPLPICIGSNFTVGCSAFFSSVERVEAARALGGLRLASSTSSADIDT